MIGKIKKAIQLLKSNKQKNVSLRRKLMLYLCSMIFVAIGMGIFLLIASGNILSVRKEAGQYLEYQLGSFATDMENEIEEFTGYGINLAKKLNRVMDNELYNGTIDISKLNDEKNALNKIQRDMFFDLESTIQMGRSSGVFAVIDATTNSKIPAAEYSRSGVYIKLMNVSSSVILSPELSYFRGTFEIAREQGIDLHNRWNLEVNIDNVPGYKELIKSDKDINEAMFWSEKFHLTDAGEEVIVLCLPIIGKEKANYGVCGIELNSTHYKLKYPSVESKYGPMVVVLAPIEEGALLIDKGMLGGTEGTWFKDTGRLKIGKGQYYNKYYSENGNYIGMHRNIKMQGKDGREWAVAVLVPETGCEANIRKNTFKMLAITLAFILVMVLVSLFLSKKFVAPILQGFDNIKESGDLEGYSSGIKELDNLLEVLKSKTTTNPTETDIPPDVEEMFNQFIEGVKTLTKAEYSIFHYYMDGYQVSEIPDLAFISMSTVKKHNRNMYDKLGISSNDELMLYLDLLNRFGKYDELEREFPK